MSDRLGLGRVFNVIPAASGIHIPMSNAAAVSFVTFEDDGSTILTLNESIDGASEQNLVVIDTAHKAPGVGGSWTKITQTAAATIDLADDTTNDAMVVTISASELSDTFNSLEATVDGGICIAIIHDLSVKRAGENLASNLTN